VSWLGISRGKYFKWVGRYGKANEHNCLVPRETWILPEERQAILDFHELWPLVGYRRPTYMMIDEGIVAVSPSTVYRVLHSAKRLDRWNCCSSKKGTGQRQQGGRRTLLLVPQPARQDELATIRERLSYEGPRRSRGVSDQR